MRPALALALLVSVTACSEKPAEPVPSSGSPAATTKMQSSARPPTSARPQRQDTGRKPTEPHVMKAYQADRCYVGLLALRFARTSYEKSLGKERPGPKVPDFGAPESKNGDAAHVYQRLVRVCNAAGSADKPEQAELDKALDLAVEVGPPLGQAIADAGKYYEGKENEKDSFAKGRELHSAIKKGFERLDEATKGVADALPLYKKAFPPKWEAAPAQKTQMLVDHAVSAFVLLTEGKDAAEVEKDLAAVTSALGELEQLLKSLKGDAYGVYVPKMAQAFVEKAKAAAQDKSSPALVSAALALEDLLEAQNNAYKRDRAGIVEPEPGMNPHHGMQ